MSNRKSLPLVKVCGMRDARNIRQVEELGIDIMGFIFWEPSRRYVAQKPDYLPSCARAGVFVDAPQNDIVNKVREFGLTYVQLHGKETPDFCHKLKQVLQQNGLSAVSLIKAFNIAQVEDLAFTSEYADSCALFLFDTKTPLPGGSGKQFDWQILDSYQGSTPFLLSGGIGPEDCDRLKQFHHPLCRGIDLNSRFELEPALKDVTQLEYFLKQWNA